MRILVHAIVSMVVSTATACSEPGGESVHDVGTTTDEEITGQETTAADVHHTDLGDEDVPAPTDVLIPEDAPDNDTAESDLVDILVSPDVPDAPEDSGSDDFGPEAGDAAEDDLGLVVGCGGYFATIAATFMRCDGSSILSTAKTIPERTVGVTCAEVCCTFGFGTCLHEGGASLGTCPTDPTPATAACDHVIATENAMSCTCQ